MHYINGVCNTIYINNVKRCSDCLGIESVHQLLGIIANKWTAEPEFCPANKATLCNSSTSSTRLIGFITLT